MAVLSCWSTNQQSRNPPGELPGRELNDAADFTPQYVIDHVKKLVNASEEEKELMTEAAFQVRALVDPSLCASTAGAGAINHLPRAVLG